MRYKYEKNNTINFVSFSGKSFYLSGTSFAAKQTITFKVDGMYCSACPAIIKKVLINVDGVKDAIVSYSQKTAVVTFEDTKTEVTNLTEAIAKVGYKANVVY